MPTKKVYFEVTEAAAVMIDCSDDKDRSQILTGYVSENITGLKRFG